MGEYKNIIVFVTSIVIMNVFTIYSNAFEQINFENITIDDGLSQSTTEVMLQDSDGYIWIGTNDGLNRYNGSEFKIFKSDDRNNNSIVSNYIISLAEDKNRKLWVGTDDGLSVINLEDYSIKNYRCYDDKKDTPFYNIKSILITKKGKVLIATYNGVYLYDEKKDSFSKILGDNNELTNNNVSDMKEDKDHNIWIGTESGLNKIDIKTNKIYKYTNEDNPDVKWDKIDSLMCDDDNNIWISTYENGLIRLNINTNKTTSFKFDKNNPNSIPSNTTRGILQDTEGSVWIATEKGLSKYEGSNKFITYTNKGYDVNSISNDVVYTLMQDKSGLLWVGTYAGISLFDPVNNIQLYKSDPLDDNSLSDNVIHGIYEDEDGLLWVGTRDSGLNIIDRNSNQIRHIYEGNSEYKLSTNSIKVITGKDNIVWVGTRNGVNKIDKNSMKITKYTTENGLTHNNIKSLLLDSKGYLWIGSEEGLNILNTKTNEIIDLTKVLEENGLVDTYIEEIYEDSKGVYWLGEYISGTLVKINPKDKSVTIYTNFSNKVGSVNTIRSIIEDKNNNLWIGTSNGLIKFNLDTEKYKIYTEEDGLSNNIVYGVMLDDEGNPWMSTNNGISNLILKTNKFKNLASTDGLQSNEFNGKAYYKCKNGEFIFGGIKGLNIFNPENIFTTSYTPKVTFDNFEVGGKNYSNIDGLSFKHNENLIRIKYFIPEYKRGIKVKYYYQLEGLSDEWVEVKSNEVIFNGLDSGKYTFKIKAQSQNGSVGEESKVSFSIDTPIWKSEKAIMAYFIIIIIIIYMEFMRIKRLDKLVARRTKELSREMKKNSMLFDQLIEAERSKNNYFINLSHELRTPLNVINSAEQLITNFNKSEKGISQEKLDYYMEVMRNNTRRLLNLINNIIDTSKIENGKYKINVKDENIVYVVEEAALTLKDMIESSNIELLIDTDTEEKIIKCDAYEIERCIVNLVNNAAKFTPEGGKIMVNIEDLGDDIKISVEDTGIGIDEKYHETIFDRFNQVVDEQREVKGGSGLGLTITKHIINLHHGEIFVESEKGKGTKFTIILPSN